MVAAQSVGAVAGNMIAIHNVVLASDYCRSTWKGRHDFKNNYITNNLLPLFFWFNSFMFNIFF